MLRRHMTPIILLTAALFLLGTACVIRTRPAHHGPGAHSQQKHEKKHHKHKKHSKHKKHK